MTEKLKKVLKKELASMEKAVDTLRVSFEKCQKIGIKSTYSYDELESFEALSARFSRLSDLMIQKIFRLIDQLELASEGTIVDRINRAEKKGLIASAETFASIRRLRNMIADEYEADEYTRVFENVLDLVPPLLEAAQSTINYCQKFD